MSASRRELLQGAGALALAGSSLPTELAFAQGDAPQPQIASGAEIGRRSLDEGWAFHLGDIPFPRVMGHAPSYENAKAGKAHGAAAPEYDDFDWRRVDLPHDWAMELPADPKENLAQGYRPRGLGWYRRAFRLDPSERGRYLELQFGAIATNATVWFNGNIVSHNWSGYNSVYADVTAMARYGADPNIIAVRVDADKMEGWWYEGAGLYRHTWLISRPPVHIVSDGVYAHPRQDEQGRWRLPVEVTLYNITDADAAAEVAVELRDPAGQVVGRALAPARVGPLDRAAANLSIDVASPRLWSIEAPNLYTVHTRLTGPGAASDERVTTAGFRSLRFDAQQGFFLNDRPTKIKGVCIHQDHAGVGVAVPDSLLEWRVRKLKEMGCNAIRSSHNAPDVPLLDACDRLGILVMNENRLFNISPDYVEQLRWLVRRDRNHPSVFMWSVFNEEPIQGTETGYEMVRRMVDEVKDLDTTRPVTAAMNNGMFTPVNVSHAVDVVGFNYQHKEYDRYHAAHSDKPLISSEDHSGFMTRGEWATDKDRRIATSYDTEAARWGATQRNGWREIATRPFVAGGFAWTGFDYHGEPTPYVWPSKSSYFGIMDLCGFPKMAHHIKQAQWITDRPVLHLGPHWNWPGKEGQPIKVMAASNAQRVRLLLNGKLVSEQAVDPYEMNAWETPYAPGRLEAVGLVDGKVVSRARVETTGAPVALRLTPDRNWLLGDGRDAQPITVEALDQRGRPDPTADLPLEFAVEGGRIIGLGNGDPTSAELSKGTRHRLFNGLAQVIVQTDAGSRGALRLSVASPGVRSAALSLRVRPAAVPTVGRAHPTQLLRSWRQSPLSVSRPDPTALPAANDMNTWTGVTAGSDPRVAEGVGFFLLTTRLKPTKALAANGGVLDFERLTGRGEVWVDGKLAARKTESGAAPFQAPLARGAGERVIVLLMEAMQGVRTGLPSLVRALPHPRQEAPAETGKHRR